MKKLFVIIMMLIAALSLTGVLFGYGEGPSGSGNWVYGNVTYSSGVKCKNCCPVVVGTASGMSERGCTNSSGEYKIYVSSSTVKAIYFRGKKVWSGSKNCQGGVRINIKAG